MFRKRNTKPLPPTREQVADQLRRRRLELAFQPQKEVFADDPQLALKTLPDNRQLVALNGESTLPDFRLLTILNSIHQEEDLTLLGENIQDYHWKSKEFQVLAQDSWNGLLSSIKRGLKQQLELQVQCLSRAITRDLLKGAGFDSQEVRFSNEFDHRWGEYIKTRTFLQENVWLEDEDHSYYILTNWNARPKIMKMHNVHNTNVRISGQAFKALELLQRLPTGVVEDAWIAELLDKKLDPLLIVQIGGYSYSLCEWDE